MSPDGYLDGGISGMTMDTNESKIGLRNPVAGARKYKPKVGMPETKVDGQNTILTHAQCDFR